MKRTYEFQGNTINVEATIWQKPDRPTMVFFSRSGKQVAAWNVTAQKWSPKTSAGALFLDSLKREFADIMSNEPEASEEAGQFVSPVEVIEALLTIIPDFSDEPEDSRLGKFVEGPMPKSWYEKKAHNDALLEKNLHSAAEWRAKMEA